MDYAQMVVGLIKMGGAVKNKQEAAQAATLAEKTKPVKRTSQFIRDETALNESELANGMSAEAEHGYNDTNDRDLSSSISALLKSGGSTNNIGDIYDSSARGRQNLAMMQDQLRMQKVQNLIKSYDTSAAEEEKNWLVNLYKPYQDKLQAIGEQKKAAAAQMDKGMDTFAAGVSGSGGGSGSSNLGSMFGGGGGSMGGGSMGGSMGGGSAGSAPSDKRLKHNYHIIGKSPSGINIYEFSYNGSNDRYQGVLAQEVMYATYVMPNGFLGVDYSKIDVPFKKI